MTRADWIAVDWGTTHLRAWAMRGNTAIAQASSDKGMNALTRDEFEPTLLDLITPWLTETRTTDVVCCGMVGARQGWVEAPYQATPCRPVGQTLVKAPTKNPRITVRVIPGLSQSKPPDVMRGEETQIAGFLALNTDWDGVICLPGTHSKWVHVSAGEVVSFQTCLTGEMFALLADASVLRHSIAQSGWDSQAFVEAIDITLTKPETLAAQLFRLRADGLLNGTSPEISRARLSGLLIGAELAATRPYWLGQQVAVIGADAVAKAYVDALAHQGVAAILAKAEAMTLAGLASIHRITEPLT